MPRILRTLAFSLALLVPAAALAMPPELQARVESLVQESDGLYKQRIRWEGVQQALLKQKQQIDAAQNAILQQQADVNQRGAAHNAQVTAQAQKLKSGKDDCNNDSDNSSGHANECANKAKAINQESGDLNTDSQTLKSEQDSLDAQYAKANQDASEWNSHEQQAVKQMNSVYHATNDWLDRAYAVITDGDFRDEVTNQQMDAACENRGLPSGTLSIATETRLADYYRKCLKAVLAAQRRAGTPATP